jgi:hypothetical protein
MERKNKKNDPIGYYLILKLFTFLYYAIHHNRYQHDLIPLVSTSIADLNSSSVSGGTSDILLFLFT